MRLSSGCGTGFAAAFALMMSSAALANDTTAVLEAGGLVFTRQDDIVMVKEDLFISPGEVRVDYVFSNESKVDVDTMVAFPMPDIGGDFNFMGGVPDVEKDNFLDFTVSQDGKAIVPDLQQRAYVGKIDVTGEIVKQGLSLQPLSESTRKALLTLAPDVQRDWIARGLIVDMAYNPDGPATPDLYPVWRLETAYVWRTIFPAGRKVNVHHRYRPSVGGTVAMTFIQDGKPTEYFQPYKERYCIDDAFMKAAARLEARQDVDKGLFNIEKWLSYVLTTGANWSGPIRDFTLTVDKERPENLVSFCGENVEKTGPTTFRMRARDFYPQKDLHILLVGPNR